jgi:hypothetical protein
MIRQTTGEFKPFENEAFENGLFENGDEQWGSWIG